MIRDVSVTLVPLQGYDRLDAIDPEKNIKKVCTYFLSLHCLITVLIVSV